MNLKPLLLIAGAAGAAAAAIKRRGGAQQIQQAASSAAANAPQPVKDAAQKAGETVQRAVENAPDPVKDAVEKVTPSGAGDGGAQAEERYEPPAEALSQPPVEAGGPPSDAVPVTAAGPTSGQAIDQLNVPDHGPPEGAVMPDTSADDPLVREAEKAAAGDAGAIGGNADEMAAADESFPTDPEMRPVVEGAGDENEETFEVREGLERGNRETET
jgi:hypothetical protein